MKKTIILVMTSFLSIFYCQGQNLPSVDIISGFGLPESFHIGCKIHTFEKNQFGLYYGNGLIFSNDYAYNSFTIDHQYHFGRISELNHRAMWFFKQGLSYGMDNSEYSKKILLFLNLSIGREFSISPKMGFSGDLGLFRVLIEEDTIKNSEKVPWIDMDLKDFIVLPVIRFQFTYSL